MATTLIESLAIAIGFDTRGLNKQAADVEAKVEDVGKAGEEATAVFKGLGTVVTQFLTLLGTSVAMKSFIEDTIKENAALERLSKNLNVNVEDVSAWGNAVRESGGSASDLHASLSLLSKAQTELAVTGQSSLVPYLSALGVSLADSQGKARNVTDVLQDLAERFSHMPRQQAFNIGQMLGLNQGTLNLLLQGPKAVAQLVARQKEYNAVTQRQGEQALKLDKQLTDLRLSWLKMGNDLMEVVGPALEKVLGWFQGLVDWVQQNREVTLDFLKLVAVAIAGITIAALPLSGTILLVTALGAAIALLWQDYQTWKRGGDSLIDWSTWEKGINLAKKGIEDLIGLLQKLKPAAEEGFHALGSIAKVWSNGLKGNNAAAAEEAGKLENRIRGWIGAKPIQLPSTQQLQSLNEQSITAKQMQDYFTNRGKSPIEAAGLAANLMSESGGRLNATGDNGTAYGLGQWHKKRQDDFARWAGHDIRLSTGDEQLGFVLHELNTTESNAADKLKAARSGYEAGAAISRYYERPLHADAEAESRGKLASQLMGLPGAATPLATSQSGPQSGSGAVDNSSRVQIDKIEVHTSSDNAPGIARDIGSEMDFQLTAQSNSGIPF